MARILIVEDEPDIREVFERGLTHAGHEVETAADGRTAHDLIFRAATPYDLVLTDLFLPSMTGVELLRAVCPVLRGRTQFVVVSGMAAMLEELGDLEQEAAAILHKPVDLKTLQATVDAALARTVTPVPRGLSAEQRVGILLRQNEDLFQRVRLDALTDLPNRRRWIEDRRVLEVKARRYGAPFALAVVDIDDFGRFNRLYGLEAGDQAIQLVSRVLRSSCRGNDQVYRGEIRQDAYRYGGDEFLLVLRAPDEPTASTIMDRIREALAEAQRVPGPGLPPERVTFSAGVALYDPSQLVLEDAIFEQAQRRLKEAKAAGGNAVRPLPPPRPRVERQASHAPFPERGRRRWDGRN